MATSKTDENTPCLQRLRQSCPACGEVWWLPKRSADLQRSLSWLALTFNTATEYDSVAVKRVMRGSEERR